MYKNLVSELSSLKGKMSKDKQKDFDEMMAKKEEELEKMNHMNASYRYQLIELKMSMSKGRISFWGSSD